MQKLLTKKVFKKKQTCSHPQLSRALGSIMAILALSLLGKTKTNKRKNMIAKKTMTRTTIQISNPRDLPQLMAPLAFFLACDKVPQAGFEPDTGLTLELIVLKKRKGASLHLVAQLQ